MSGPVTATRGAAVLLRAAIRAPGNSRMVRHIRDAGDAARQPDRKSAAAGLVALHLDAYGRTRRVCGVRRVYRLPDWKKCTCESISRE